MTPKSNSSSETLTKQVRERLLEIAERHFSENGFDGTNIRKLTKEAGCNVAAVNYHFGNKKNLYGKVFHRRLALMRDVRITSIEKVMTEKGDRITLEDLLNAFAYAFLEPFVDESGGRRFIKLLAREMVDPMLSPQVFVEEVIKPVLAVLIPALHKVCPGISTQKAIFCVHSLVGQLIHAIRTKELFEGQQIIESQMFELGKLIDHIVEFSAAGIRGCAEGE
ncbi:MAG: TetR/AcrR family transcriptional regulator [Planctomycetota bacterium]|jgi:AcrR family transcriptional regulator